MMMNSAGARVVDVAWCFLAVCFLAALCLHNLCRKHDTGRVYLLFQDLIRYGKTKQHVTREKWLRVFDVPKRWFWHFYAISLGWNGFLLVQYLDLSLRHQALPLWLSGTVHVLSGRTTSTVPQVSVLLLLLLLLLHSARRLLECVFVSVFSDGSMHVVQYVFGLGYYLVLGLTALCSDHQDHGPGAGSLRSQLHWFHAAGVGLFIAASLVQHRCLVLLARLRTGHSGAVETLAHRVPHGGCFQLVSCPHYFAELLIYVSLAVVSGSRSLTWWLVVLYVLFNQALAAQLCHELYISKYKSYPKHRRAFIPFVF